MKKFVLALLAVVLVLGLSSVAFAEECTLPHEYGAANIIGLGEVSAATCEDARVIKVKCTGCNEEFTMDDPTHPATDCVADVNGIQIDAADCDTDGFKYFHCKWCGERTDVETIPQTGHTPVKTGTTAPTCDEEGVEYFKCDVCGDTWTESIDELGHDLVEIYQAATCFVDGLEGEYCKRCDYEDVEVIEKYDHKDAAGKDNHKDLKLTYAVEDCYNEGSYLYECSYEWCTHTVVKTKDALGHDWSNWDMDEEATCTTAGFRSRDCQRPGCLDARSGKPAEDVEIIPALGHDIIAGTVVAPDCTEAGYEIGTCKRCEETVENPLEALGHDMSEWTVTECYRTRTCERKGCEYFEVEAINCPADPETPADPEKPADPDQPATGDDNDGEGSGSSTGSGSDASIPATGDNTSNVPYIMMVAAVAGLVALVASKRKVNC